MSPGAYYTGLAITAFLVGWSFWRGDWFAGLLFVPVFGYFAGRTLVITGFDVGAWLRTREKRPWNGIYYEYGTIHLRAVETDAGLVFVEDDLLEVIGQRGSRMPSFLSAAERVRVEGTPWHALTESGCEHLLLKSPHRDAKSLLLYLQRQAFRPYARRMARAAA